MKSKASNAKKSEILLNDIYVGKVVHVKEYYENENTDEQRRRFTNLKIRKIVFTVKGDEGIDLYSGLCKKDKYSYKVIDFNTVEQENTTKLKNNILIIDEPKRVGELLIHAGFPSVVRGKDIKKITKLLLSKDRKLNIQKHSLRLNGSHIFNIYQVNQANEQAVDLYKFKVSKLPTKPQEIEKSYKKSFK